MATVNDWIGWHVVESSPGIANLTMIDREYILCRVWRYGASLPGEGLQATFYGDGVDVFWCPMSLVPKGTKFYPVAKVGALV